LRPLPSLGILPSPGIKWPYLWRDGLAIPKQNQRKEVFKDACPVFGTENGESEADTETRTGTEDVGVAIEDKEIAVSPLGAETLPPQVAPRERVARESSSQVSSGTESTLVEEEIEHRPLPAGDVAHI